MFRLRLGIHQWAAVDRSSIESAFQHASFEGGLAWRLVTEPPFDALVMICPAQRSEDTSRLAKVGEVTLALVRSDGHVHPLELPFRCDGFRSVLRRVQCELLGDIEAEWESADLPDTSVTAHAPHQIMLRHWPPASLLYNDPSRVRMAALLIERKFSMPELASVSGQSVAQCSFFVQALHRAGLVEHYSPGTTFDVPQRRGTLCAASSTAERKSLKQALFGSIKHWFKARGRAGRQI